MAKGKEKEAQASGESQGMWRVRPGRTAVDAGGRAIAYAGELLAYDHECAQLACNRAALVREFTAMPSATRQMAEGLNVAPDEVRKEAQGEQED